MLQGKPIRYINGNWDHILEAHGITEAEVISVFKSRKLRPKRNKKHRMADYMVVGKAFTGRMMRICYSWDDEYPDSIWVYTAF